VSVVSGIQHAIHMPRIVICGLSGSTMFFSHYLINDRVFFKVTKYKMYVSILLQLLSKVFIILKAMKLVMIINVYCFSCKVLVILVRF
jgi:hypothetical protein